MRIASVPPPLDLRSRFNPAFVTPPRRGILSEKRAEYGQEIVVSLARQLEQEYGRGFAEKNLRRMVQFDEHYRAGLDDLPSASDKVAALEAALNAELAEDDQDFVYRLLGERLQQLKERKDADDEAAARRLRELEEIAAQKLKVRQEPERLNLKEPGTYGLFTVLRAHAKTYDEGYLATCARRMVAHLHTHRVLTAGWSRSIGGRKLVEESLLAESWNPDFAQLGFDVADENPAFLPPTVEERARTDT